MAVTVTTGGEISGYCAIGSTRMAARPARMMKIDRTAAKIDRPRLGLIRFIHDINELPLRAFEHRSLGNRDRVRTRRALEDDAHELTGTQDAFGVRQLG